MKDSRSAEPSPPTPLDGIVAAVVDGSGTLVSWTPGAARLLGHGGPEPAPLGRRARDLVAVRRTFGRPEPHGGAPGGRVLSLRTRDGGTVDVWVRLLPLGSGAGGDGLLVLGLPMDTLVDWRDGLAIGSAALRQEEWQITLHDSALGVRRSSPEVARSGRLSADGDLLCGMPRLGVAGLASDVLRAAMETGASVVDESGLLRGARPDDRGRVYSLTAAPVRDLWGRIDGVFSSLVDVTERFRAADRLDLVYRASRGIGRSLVAERIAEDLVDFLVPALGDLAAVEFSDGLGSGAEPPRRVEGLNADFRRAAAKHAHGPWPDDQVAVGELLPRFPDRPGFRHLERGDVLVGNGPGDYREFLGDGPGTDRLVPAGAHASMGAALVAGGHVLGYVQVFRTRRPYPFDGQDAKLMKEIVNFAALAIDNARRYAHERRTAAALRSSLRPPVSGSTASVDSAGFFRAAVGDTGVGGDWFDALALSSLRTALVVGDVIGHGLPATTTMARLRTAIHTLAELDLPPDELLTRLDDLVQRMAAEAEHPDVVGASCLYAVYDPVSRVCRFASAGHPPPAVIAPDGGVSLVDVPPGPFLGVGGMPFEVVEVALEPGSVIALYSDGLLTVDGADGAADGLAGTGSGGASGTDVTGLLRSACRPGRSLEEAGMELLSSASPTRRHADDTTVLLARTRAVAPADVAEWEFPQDLEAVAQARRLVGEQLALWGLDDLAFTTELVVSELVTNAMRYAGGRVGLRLIRDRVLVCEVTDTSNSHPRLRRAVSTDEGGRGLFLVAQVTARWGSRYSDSGKTIWTEQTIPR
ncbi:SpoIIE family protein phosphatase [Streptomyces sp. NPDC088090]|uniref:ATP-binding SpoIIE family protein phosphatase n=1 Tax=Streptomyces sp. NPDC088090 TaxID=3365822 RepID=UPI00384B91C4